MSTRILDIAPEKFRPRPFSEYSLFDNSPYSKRKVIKDYVYTPEYKLIGK